MQKMKLPPTTPTATDCRGGEEGLDLPKAKRCLWFDQPCRLVPSRQSDSEFELPSTHRNSFNQLWRLKRTNSPEDNPAVFLWKEIGDTVYLQADGLEVFLSTGKSRKESTSFRRKHISLMKWTPTNQSECVRQEWYIQYMSMRFTQSARHMKTERQWHFCLLRVLFSRRYKRAKTRT